MLAMALERWTKRQQHSRLWSRSRVPAASAGRPSHPSNLSKSTRCMLPAEHSQDGWSSRKVTRTVTNSTHRPKVQDPFLTYGLYSS